MYSDSAVKQAVNHGTCLHFCCKQLSQCISKIATSISFLLKEYYLLGWKSPDSSVGIVMGRMLEARGSIPGRGKTFSIFHSVQTNSEAHPASCPMGTGGLSLKVKRPGREANHSPPSGAEVKNDSPIPLLSHLFMA
jgi:hypothetical protein